MQGLLSEKVVVRSCLTDGRRANFALQEI